VPVTVPAEVDTLVACDVLTSTAAVVISGNPTLVYNDVSVPGSAGTRTDIIAVCLGNRGRELKVPVAPGEVIYVVFSGVTSAVLYFDKLSLAE